MCRHSKPESPDPPGSDHKRKLTANGKRDARAIGTALSERGLLPNAVLSSDSIRTRQTTALICEAFPIKPKIAFLPELYSATSSAIVNSIESHAAETRTILVVGHNPGMEDVVRQLAGETIRLSTSTVAVFEVDGERVSDDGPLAGLRLREVFGPPKS